MSGQGMRCGLRLETVSVSGNAVRFVVFLGWPEVDMTTAHPCGRAATQHPFRGRASMRQQPNPRAALRQAFPTQAPVLRDCTFADLVRWFRITQVQRLAWPTFSVAGFRWRRAADRAVRALGDRVVAHAGPAYPRCDQCQSAIATRHHVRKSDGQDVIVHFCFGCASAAPIPWFVLAQASSEPARKSASPPAR
jgi:hypothetical protein